MADTTESASQSSSREKMSSSELELVERVFLKIVGAETDEKLQGALGTFLTPVLLKLGCGNERVKNKVIELLTHINKRLKSRPKILLPVDALLKQYEDKETNKFVINFTLMYIKMGAARMDKQDQVKLIPRIFNCMKGKPKQQQEMLMLIIVPLLNELEIPDDVKAKKKIICFYDDQALCKLVQDFMMDVLFLPYSNGGQRSADASTQTAAPAPPGLSKRALERLKFDPPLDAERIEQAKLGIIRILGSDIFPAVDVLCHFVVANGDSKHSVSDKAEHCLKRLPSPDDWEQNQTVEKLYSIFQGTAVAPGNPSQALTADQARSPASLRLKMKIFPFLLRSKKATNFNPAASIKIIFESLFGEESNSRLRKFAVEFCHHMCQFSTDKTMSFVAPLLFQAFVKVSSNKKEEAKLRGLSYTGLGRLAKRTSSIFKRDIALVQKLFEVLEEEAKEIRLSVQEALSMIAPAYKGINGTDASLMEALVLSNLEKESSQTRLAALQFANAVFPVTHVPSRYACLLASADVKDDVREEAKRGLKPNPGESKEEIQGIGEYPSFSEICDYLHVKITAKVQVIKDGSPVLPTPIFEQILLYLRLCLHATANVTKQQTVTGETLQSVAKYMTGLLEGIADISASCIGRYIEILKLALISAGGAVLHATALKGILEVVAAAPLKMSKLFEKDIRSVKKFLQSTKEEARNRAARLMSILSNSMPENVFLEMIKEMAVDMLDKSPEKSHGAMLGLAYSISRYSVQQSKLSDCRLEDLETDNLFHNHVDAIIRETFTSIALKLSDDNLQLRHGACYAIGVMCRCMAMPLKTTGDSDQNDDKQPSDEMPEKKVKREIDLKSHPDEDTRPKEEEISKELVADKLITLLSDSKDTKTKEKAAISLGNILIGEPEFPYREKILKALFSTSKAKQLELNFTVGEALSCAGAGKLSLAAKDKWSLDAVKQNPVKCDDAMAKILETIISDYSYSTANFNKQAAAVWLLSIVKYSSEHPTVKDKLEDIQSCFMELLSSSDEITQDVASRGISLVYEQVGEDKRDELVSMLVERLMTGKRAKPKVDADTELFDRGGLGTSPEGGSLSTYKELCSLASSLNRPDLVYKFMNLANHNAIWNSRKGAAFGFLSIASQAGKQLEPFLPQLIPKLYRYQYDPNPDVQKAMANIWTALVPDGKKSLDKYTKEIVGDLLGNMTNYLWRIRESSCSALSDLIRNAPVEDFLDELPKIWEITFKVIDDIKESVRKSAAICGITISKVTIRICDVTLSKLGEKAVALILPVLLNVGLASRVDAVKALSLDTLVKISKSAGKFLKPHIPKLTTALLESLSGLEPQYLNTLSLQLTKSQDAQEKLDAIRVSASKSSPMMDTINKCVQFVDAEILSEIIPGLAELIKTGIGLGTKVGCANFVISLTLQCRNELQRFSGKLLAALLSGLSVPNNTVKHSYANAIGHLVKYSKETSVEKLVMKLRDRYVDQEDQAKQLFVAWTYQAMSRHSPDVLKLHASIILPVVFLAMHQEKPRETEAAQSIDNNTKEIWEEIWQNSTPGTQSGIKLYLDEIFETVSPVLSSPSWALKAQAAQSIGTIASSLGASLAQPYLGNFLSILLKAAPGRTWDGKEQILKSMSSICIKCREGIEKSFSSSSPCPDINEIVNTMLKECKKDNLKYKVVALDSTSQIIEKYELGKFTEMKDIVQKYLKKQSGDDDADDKDESAEEVKKESLIICCLDSLGRCWPHDTNSQELHVHYLVELLIRLLNLSVWRIQTSILRLSETLFKRLDWNLALTKWQYDDAISVAEKIVDSLIQEVCSCIESTTHASVRLQGFKSIKMLLQSIKDCTLEETLKARLQNRLRSVTTPQKDSTNFEISQIVTIILGYLNNKDNFNDN